MPEAVDDLELHNCLPTGDQDVWRLESPAGSRHIRPRGNIRSNCCELTREATLAGIGISLLSSWDAGPSLMNGDLRVILPEWRGVSSDAIWAVYPSRDFMPSKVTVFIDYLTELYGLQPYWSKDFDLNAVLGCKSAGPQISNPEKTKKSKAGSAAQSAKKSGPTNDLTC